MEISRICGKTELVRTALSSFLLYSLSEREAVLIDSGFEPCPELLDTLEQRNQRVVAILCTHPHIDHIANNQLFYEKHHATIYFSETDANALKTGQWMFGNTQCNYPYESIPSQQSYFCVHGVFFDIIPTPGHTPGHLAIATPDGVCFLGDALLSLPVLKTAKLPYMVSVEQCVQSMIEIGHLSYPHFVVSHIGLIPPGDFQKTVQANIDKELKIMDRLLAHVTHPMPVTHLADALLDELGVSEFARKKYGSYWMAMSRIFELEYSGQIIIDRGIVFLPF